MREFLKYSRTSPQRPPQGQKKEAVVEGGPLWGGTMFGCNTTIFLEGVQHASCAIFMLNVSHNSNNPIIKYAKSFNYVLNQNVVNVKKREKLATFTMGVIDNRSFA